MESSSFERLKELNLTGEEVDRLRDAFKKEEFRQLFADYVDEIQDPKNRQIYEEEIKQLELERGQEVTFLHPTPGYVIKTSINGNVKGFINVCSNSNISKCSSTASVKNGDHGVQWSLPHSLSPPHDDLDNKGARCQVFDVLFHPDTLNLASNSTSFRSLLNNTAVEAVEKNFDVQLDKKNLKFPKLSYKGTKRASVMRKPSKSEPVERGAEEKEIFDKLYADIDSQRHSNVHKSRKTTRSKEDHKEHNSSPYTIPLYSIKHRNYIDIQDFAEDKNAKMNAAIPKELVIEINLPLLKSSNDMQLDVTEKTVQLASEKPAKYKLNLTLPYHVHEANGTAKFDKNQKKLIITLPVKRSTILDLSSKEDSGVESDLNSPLHPQSNDFCDNKKHLIDVIETKSKNEFINNSVEATSDFTINNCIDDFLKSNEAYTLPEFTCNVFDNVVAFTFNVKNVDEKSVHKICLLEEALIKIKFSSVSASFYITNYSFYVKFPNHKYMADEVSVEIWDNNVILQVPLINSSVQFSSYVYGSNGVDFVEKFIEEPAVINRILEKEVDNINLSKTQQNGLTESEDDFLDDIKCILPEFTCNLFDDIVAFTFNVENVIEKSVYKTCLTKKSIIKMKFSNCIDVIHDYLLYLMFPFHEYFEEQITVTTGVNNVILQVPLAKSKIPFTSYFCGLSEDNLTEKFLEEPTVIHKLLENQLENIEEFPFKNPIPPLAKSQGTKQPKKTNFSKTKAIDIQSHSYESSGDELSASSSSPGKSILKRMIKYPFNFGRSVSESSIDDIMYSSYENHHYYNNECVPEDEAAEDISSSLKKTVRFNDVVSRQLFRSNSSILGQRKKNQRKARNKKRASEHRYSESEASDVDSNKREEEKTKSKCDNNNNKKEKGKKVQDAKKDCDGENIFHLEMNT